MPADLAHALSDIAVTAAHEPAAAPARIAAHLAELCRADLTTVFERRRDRLHCRAAHGSLATPALERLVIDPARLPSIAAALAAGQPLAMTDDDHAAGDGDVLAAAIALPPGHACLFVPLRAGGVIQGALTLDRRSRDGWSAAELAIAGAVAGVAALALHAARQTRRLERVRLQLDERQAAGATAGGGPPPLLEHARAPAMRNAALLARQVAATDSPVLLTGETGAGKEVLARALHAWSRRAAGPFVALNCAALPETLVESELFGHAAGAFSGASGPRPGRFAVADGGTLLLDEIGELPPAVQAKLLRVLQEGAFEAVGSDRTVAVDVRIIAATNRDLERAMAEGRFRADLYYRLAVFPIHLPPLRERREDILPLAEAWLAAQAATSGRGPWRLSAAAAAHLLADPWPGNVRELRNCLERATILCPRGELAAEHLPLRAALLVPTAPSSSTQREQIRAALTRCGGRIYGPRGAAALLGVKPSTLQSRMQRLGLARLDADLT